MLFNNRARLEEDLERIRKANLPLEKRLEEEQKEEAEKKAIKKSLASEEGKLTIKDIFAMTIAILSLILPYAAIIILAMGVVALFLMRGAIF